MGTLETEFPHETLLQKVYKFRVFCNLNQFNMKFFLVCMVYCVGYAAALPFPPFGRSDKVAGVETVLSKFTFFLLLVLVHILFLADLLYPKYFSSH